MQSWADILAKLTSYDPGQRFEYGPYHVNAFAAALQCKLQANDGTNTYEAYLKRRILDPLGIQVQRLCSLRPVYAANSGRARYFPAQVNGGG